MAKVEDIATKISNPKEQSLLGNFIGGLPSGRAQSMIEEAFQREEERKRNIEGMMPDEKSFSHSSDEGGGFAYNDMANMIVDIMTKLRGSRVIICPTCYADVEKFSDSFCKCNKCDLLYFTVELIHEHSFRLVRPTESVQSYELFATTNQQFVRCFNGEKYEEVES